MDEQFAGGVRYGRFEPGNTLLNHRGLKEVFPSLFLGIRRKVNAIPGWSRTAFRDEPEQYSGMKVNTDSRMKPNIFRPIPEPRSA